MVDVIVECFNIEVAAEHKLVKISEISSECYRCRSCVNVCFVLDEIQDEVVRFDRGGANCNVFTSIFLSPFWL